MISSMPSSRASSASRTAEIPQSTVTIRLGLVLGRKLAQGLGVDPITFLDAMGNVVFDVGGTGEPQARPQDAGAAHAVDVVVAVNHDLAIVADRPDDSLGGVDRAGNQLGVEQAPQPGLEKRARRDRLFDAAVEQELRDQRRDAGPAAQALDAGRVVGPDTPASVHQRQESILCRADRQNHFCRRAYHQMKQGDIAMIALDPQKSKPLGKRHRECQRLARRSSSRRNPTINVIGMNITVTIVRIFMMSLVRLATTERYVSSVPEIRSRRLSEIS